VEAVAVGEHLLHAGEVDMGEEATTGEVMTVATLLEAVTVEDTEVDLEDLHHTDQSDLYKGAVWNYVAGKSKK